MKDRFACILLRMQTSNDWTARFENVLDFLVMVLTVNAVYIYTYVFCFLAKANLAIFFYTANLGV